MRVWFNNSNHICKFIRVNLTIAITNLNSLEKSSSINQNQATGEGNYNQIKDNVSEAIDDNTIDFTEANKNNIETEQCEDKIDFSKGKIYKVEPNSNDTTYYMIYSNDKHSKTSVC